MHTCTNTNTQAQAHAHAHAHALAHMHTHTRMRANAHAHTLAHTQCHAHTFISILYFRSHKPWMAMRQVVSWHLIRSFSVMLPTVFPKWKPPYDVTIYKGSNQAALTRGFAEYLLFNQTATDLLAWFRDTLAPDEYLWPTLNHNPHLRAPGAYTGECHCCPQIQLFHGMKRLTHVGYRIRCNLHKRAAVYSSMYIATSRPYP